MERTFASRARNAARRWRNRLVYERLRPELSLFDVFSRVDPATADASGSRPLARLLEAHLERTPGALWEHAAPVTAEAVERARAGEWDLLGRTMTVSPRTDWHRDPYFGARWPRRYTEALSYHRDGGDVVTLWHLNKMMFLLELAAAYRASRDPALAARVYELIDSWCIANPYLVGMNWVSALDIATRLTVWSQALAAVAEAAPPAEDRAARIVRSVLRQTDHLASHLSEWPVPNNHLLGELALLYAVASYWPVWKDSVAWGESAEEKLAAEARRQILNDGVQYEGSVNYHAYALDFLLVYLHAKAVRGQAPHRDILDKVRDMATAYLELVLPSGRRPRVGDDSVDRLFVLAHPLDGPPLDPNRNAFADSLRPEYAALLSTTSWGRDLLGIRVPARHARHFSDAGISVARDADASFLFVHGPQHGGLFAHGHLHADAGSFELEVDGVPLVVDAGTYVYFVDPEARAYFKSARAHNAPVIDDVETMRSLETFRWERVVGAEFLGFGTAPGSAAVASRRKTEGGGGVPMQHTRVLVVSRGTVMVLDAIRAGGASTRHVARVCFRTPTPPGTASLDGRCVRVADPRRFVRVIEAFADGESRVDLVDDPTDRGGWYSRWYGDLQRGVAVRVSAEFESSVVLLSVMRGAEVAVTPVRLDAADTSIAVESHGERRLVRVTLDPLNVTAGGRTLLPRGTGVADPAGARAPSAPASTTEWLDELSLG